MPDPTHVAGSRLSAFLDDELPDDAAIRVAKHLDGCPRCLHELDALRATRDALRSLPDLQAPVLTAGVVRRAQAVQRLVRRLRIAAAAVTVPLVVLVAAYALGAEVGGVEPPADLFLVEHLGRTGGGPLPSPIAGGGR